MKGNIKKNKRNITGGEIHLNQIDPSDRVDDDATEDYDNSLLKALDVQPEQIRIFFENLQNGSFIRVNELILKRKMEMMQESQKQQIQTENILLVLNKLIHNVIRIIDRFVFFFKGILLGMCLMNFVIINLNDSDDALLTQYAKYGLRIDQVFHIIILISFSGSFFVALQLNEQAKASHKPEDRSNYIQGLISVMCYMICYILNVIGHIAMGPLSVDNLRSTDAIFAFWKWSQIGIIIAALLGWFVSVGTTESQLDYLAMVHDQQQATA